jgi:3-methyladenine DNA glycosylase AlkD
LLVDLRKHAKPDMAKGQEAYMRHRFPFLGIGTPERRRLTKAHIAKFGMPMLGELSDVVRSCWRQPQREMHYTGMELLTRNVGAIGLPELPFIEELILEHSWWDTVDHLVVHGAGAVLFHQRQAHLAANARWLASGQLWLLRTALIHQLNWKGETDTAMLFANCKALAHHQDFFVRKGIGWALRQYARTDPGAVRVFVDSTGLSPLSKREALKRSRDTG